MITAKTKLCMVIGDPIGHSLSPQIHNAAYKALGLEDEYVYVASTVHIKDIPDFIAGVRAMGVQGVSCTLPHKLAVMEHLDQIDPVAKKIGAVNTIVREGSKLKGYNTDWLGVVEPLEALVPLQGKKVAVLGAGGAARAAVYGLTQRGAEVTIYNRTPEKAKALAKEFGCSAAAGQPGEELKDIDIIFNATPLGMDPHAGKSPLSKQLITDSHIVFDAIYNPYETQLVKDAMHQEARVIHGTDMLVGQGAAQFELFTGRTAPLEVMRQTLMDQLYVQA